jgi:hypothetical protein
MVRKVFERLMSRLENGDMGHWSLVIDAMCKLEAKIPGISLIGGHWLN